MGIKGWKSMREQNCNYLSYLLRIWQDSNDGEWHATLQDIFGDECCHFANLSELYRNLDVMTSKKRIHLQEALYEPFDNQYLEIQKRNEYAKKNT